jgi:hypothetical protein
LNAPGLLSFVYIIHVLMLPNAWLHCVYVLSDRDVSDEMHNPIIRQGCITRVGARMPYKSGFVGYISREIRAYEEPTLMQPHDMTRLAKEEVE